MTETKSTKSSTYAVIYWLIVQKGCFRPKKLETERQSLGYISHIRSGCRDSCSLCASLLGCLDVGVPPSGESTPAGCDPPDHTYLDLSGCVGASFFVGSCSLAACSFIAVGVVGKAASVSDRAFHDRAVARAGGIALPNPSRRGPKQYPQPNPVFSLVPPPQKQCALPCYPPC